MTDSINWNLDTHFARAIRKYGKDAFDVEIIDMASTQEELNEKEKYWIQYYSSVSNGYNETDASFKCGGNTYRSKSEDELRKIGLLLSESKSGIKNPNAKSIKCFNMLSGEEIEFGTVKECQNYFGEKHHRFITTRVTHKTKSPYRGIWKIAYVNDDYQECGDVKRKRGKMISVLDLETGIVSEFYSVREASRETGINRNKFKKSLSNPEKLIDNKYKITILS